MVVVLASVLPICAQQPRAFDLEGDVAGAHDPAMAHEGKTYYVFTTGKAADGGQLGIRCSEDLVHWRHCGHVFDSVPAWITERSPTTKDLWAPDISFVDGRYRLYYTYSVFGRNTSGIALATNETLDANSPRYKWQDEGMIFESKATDDFNAIDPNYVEDASHHAWLAFGSFWSGIKLRALDRGTGKLSTSDTTLYSLASRSRPESETSTLRPGRPANWQAIEAPFIVRHGGFYYLFVSFDSCCRGAKSTYRTMVGRAKTITGPYLDRDNKPMLQGGGTELLSGNAQWAGPGGESILLQNHGSDLLIFHAYDHASGKPSLQVSTIAWHDNWPAVAMPAVPATISAPQ